MLDKHKLTLQLSKRGATAAGGSSSKANKKAKEQDGKGAKLVVRNVAFEATRKDIMGLFGPFGHIKSCRCAGRCCRTWTSLTRAVWGLLHCLIGIMTGVRAQLSEGIGMLTHLRLRACLQAAKEV